MMDNELDTTKLREIELNMLICVDKISKELGIKYFLIGGSLLGAIRHKGFIPWDDDIDIGMLRPDYELFLSKAQELLPSYYFLQTLKTDREYNLPFAKLRDSRTTFIEKSIAHHNINHGVYIDIFPIDYYKRPSKIEHFITILLSKRLLNSFRGIKSSKNTKDKIKSLIINILIPSVKWASKQLDRFYSRLNGGNLRVNYCGAWGDKEIVDSKIFDSLKYYNFEGHSFLGPEDYHSYLSHIYGDYMKLPPEDKRISHHYTEVIDLDNPYTTYSNK